MSRKKKKAAVEESSVNKPRPSREYESQRLLAAVNLAAKLAGSSVRYKLVDEPGNQELGKEG